MLLRALACQLAHLMQPLLICLTSRNATGTHSHYAGVCSQYITTTYPYSSPLSLCSMPFHIMKPLLARLNSKQNHTAAEQHTKPYRERASTYADNSAPPITLFHSSSLPSSKSDLQHQRHAWPFVICRVLLDTNFNSPAN